MKNNTQKRLTKAKKQLIKAVNNVLKTDVDDVLKIGFKDAADPLMEFLEALARELGDPDALIGKPPSPDHIEVPPVTDTTPQGGSSSGSPLNSSNPGF